MKSTRVLLALATVLMLLSAPAHGTNGVLCIKATGKGSIKVRNPTCKPTEVQVGSFDTDTAQASFTPQDLSVLVQLSSDFSKPSGGPVVAVPFGIGSEVYDTANFHDETVNPDRLVAPVSGKYLVYATVAWSPNVSGWRMAHITVNTSGTPIAYSTMVPIATDSGQVLSTHVELTAGDYVQLNVQQNSGSTLQVYSVISNFGMVKVPSALLWRLCAGGVHFLRIHSQLADGALHRFNADLRPPRQLR